MQYTKVSLECESEIIKEPIIKTQKDWVPYFNEIGVKMISAPDIYRAAKEKNQEAVLTLRSDFEASVELTSTRVNYNTDNLQAEIVHDAGSTVVRPKSYNLLVPVIRGDFQQDAETEKYLQALFDTEDSLSEILAVLNYLGERRSIRLWTPTQDLRKVYPFCSVGLFFGGSGGFDVGGCGRFGNYGGGFSRGVQ